MPKDNPPRQPSRRRSTLRKLCIGFAASLMLTVAVTLVTKGYFGPGLPQQDYQRLYEQHVEAQSGLDATQAERSRQLVSELQSLMRQHISPGLKLDRVYLSGSEVIDRDLPAEQVAAIETAIANMESSGMNDHIDELIGLGAVVDGGSGMLRQLVAVLSGQLVLSWREGDIEQASLAYARLRGLTHATAQGSMSVIGRLVANAMTLRYVSILNRLLAERSADESLIRATQDVDTRLPVRSAWPELAPVLEGDRILSRDRLQHAGLNIPIRTVNPGAMDQAVGKLHDRVLATWELAGRERLGAIRQASEDGSWHQEEDSTASVLAPSLGDFLCVEIMTTALDRASSIALALEFFHARTGSLPSELSELVPEYLAELPLDPCSDESFHYVADESLPLGYRLYSVGFDGVDNGGVTASPDIDAFDLAAYGVDYSIMPPPSGND